MCDAPDPPEIKVPKPQYLRNPFLDDARSDAALVDSLRSGRSSLRVPLDTGLGIGFTGRPGSGATSRTAGARNNAEPRRGSGISLIGGAGASSTQR